MICGDSDNTRASGHTSVDLFLGVVDQLVADKFVDAGKLGFRVWRKNADKRFARQSAKTSVVIN